MSKRSQLKEEIRKIRINYFTKKKNLRGSIWNFQNNDFSNFPNFLLELEIYNQNRF